MDRVVIGGIELGDIVAAGIDETGIRTTSAQQASSSGLQKSSNIRYVNGDPPNNEESIGIIRHSGPANTKYSTLEARLRTFKDWPPALRQEPKQLADAGFYYIGLSDQTKCFYCEGGLRNWQPDDDPWTEHARWFSKCGYVRLIKGDEFITKCLNERPPQTPGGSKKDCQVSEEDLKAWMTSPVVIHVLNMGIDDSRIKMALKKHGKLYTDANTLATAALSMQMEEQVRMIPSQNPESQDTTPRPARSESAPCPPSTSVQLQNEDPATSKASVDLEQENQRLKEARICRICMDKEISVVFLPCGHLICCVQCAPSLRDCPLCRQSIHGTVKTYMS